MPRLNSTQRRLVQDIEELTKLFLLDPKEIFAHPESYWWTARLQLARNQLVRSQVIMRYTLVDEFLNTVIAQYYFGKAKPFWKLWKTKRFQLFNFHVLEELSLMKKLQLARAIQPIPRRVKEDIERLNALRNGIAHAFFPENLKRSKPVWKGKNIFTLAGALQFEADMWEVVHHFAPNIPHAEILTSNDLRRQTA